jgi:hypothetical protein
MRFPGDVQEGAVGGLVVDGVESEALVVSKVFGDATVTVEVAITVTVALVQLGVAAMIVVVIADGWLVTVLSLTCVKVLYAVVVTVDG